MTTSSPLALPPRFVMKHSPPKLDTTKHCSRSSSNSSSSECFISSRSGRFSDYSFINGGECTTPNTSTEFGLQSPETTSPRRSIEPSARQQQFSVEDLPIAQLKTTCKSLYGRQQEMEILQECYKKLVEQEQRQQLVIISGYSGTGKSALAATLQTTATKSGRLYATGKFDLQQNTVPYSALSMACREICGAILELAQNIPRDFQDFQKSMTRQLGAESTMFIQLIPALEEIVLLDDETVSHASTDFGIHANKGLSSTESKHRITYAFQRFLRLMTRQFQSLVLVMDDLQWADTASLDLLDKLLSDRELNNMMLIGLYRSNEVDETHPFHVVLEDWRSKTKERDYDMTELAIGNLQRSAVVSVIQDILQADDPLIEDLADLCFRKTHGNIFFLRLLLSTLYEKKLLYYNIGTMTWAWKSNQIESTIPATDNVVDLLKCNMSNISDGSIEILKLSSCLGSTFKLSILETIFLQISDASDGDRAKSDLSVVLDDLVKEGYLKRVGDDYVHFVHDRIQEASSDLISEEERLEYYHRLGVILLDNLDEGDLNLAIFVVADLLNKGQALRDEASRRLQFATINFYACQKAYGLSEFEAAADYASTAIALLGDEKWTKHSKMSLELYSMAAEAESYLGRTDQMNMYCSEVIAREDLPLESKFRIHNTLIDSIAYSRDDIKEAARQSIDLLERFGCRFPKNKVIGTSSIVWNVMRIKSSIKSWSPEGIKRLKVSKDPVRFELSRLLDKLGSFLYILNDARVTLPVFCNLRWTERYGVNQYSPAAVATTAVVLAGVLGDFKNGIEMGKAALRLLERVESRILVESRVHCLLYYFVFHWQAPLKDMLRPLLYGYEAGLKSGDTENASSNIRFFIIIRFRLGTPLERVERDAYKYSIQMKELGRISIHRALNLIRQHCLILMGQQTPNKNQDFSFDMGSISTAAEEVEKLQKEDVFLHKEAKFCRDMLCTTFGEHKQLADSVLKEKGADFPIPGSPNLIHHALARGISCFAAHRQTGKKGYLKMGVLMRSKMKSWLAKGCPNVVHLSPFLDAEYEACKGNFAAAKKSFESSVVLSARGGLLLDAALVCERFGEFYLERGENEDAAFRMGQAIQYYKEAQAYGKVRDLEGKYPQLMKVPDEV